MRISGKNLFELLRDKSILAILDGDVDFGEIETSDSRGNIKISMPYLSGPILCDISNRFGLPVTYGWNVYFGDIELDRIGDRFVIKKIGTTVKVAAPAIKTIDRDYIAKLSERAMLDVLNGYYDSAITKSRTLLEEVFCYVIEKKGEIPSESGDISKLYNQVKQLYNMHQNKDMDKRINALISGLEKILSAIAEMRNKNSDSDGIGSKRINIDEHHARLFVNSAMTMVDFVLAVGNRKVE